MIFQEQETYKQIDKYIVTNQQLGNGAFSQVYKGFVKDNPQVQLAIKVIPLEQITKTNVKLLKREIDIPQKLNNEHLVKMYGAVRTKNNLYIIQQFCNGGDLNKLLKQRQHCLSESESVVYFRQMCKGYQYLYNNNIIHRDIKPANLLINDGIILIGDFGFAKCLDQYDIDKKQKQTFLGTPLYMSPELLMDLEYNSKSDVWSMGIVFYEILFGKRPWNGSNQNDLYENIKNQPLTFPQHIPVSEMVKVLLQQMLTFEDEKRINWPQIFQHPIINQDIDVILNKIQQIKISEKDDLLKIIEPLDYYLQNTRVIGLEKAGLRSTSQDKQSKKGQEEKKEQEGNQEILEDDQNFRITKNEMFDIKKIQQFQDKYDMDQKIILQIDSKILFYRNISILIMTAVSSILKSFREKMVEFDESIFYQTVFIMLKYQQLQYSQIMQILNKIQIFDEFNENQFSLYFQSLEFELTGQLLQKDQDFINTYHNQILQVLETSYINKEKIQNSKQINELLNISKNAANLQDKQFIKMYKQVIDTYLAFMLAKLNSIKAQFKKQFLYSLILTCISKNPYNTFNWKVEENFQQKLHEFYNKYENISDLDAELELKNLMSIK